MCVNNLSKVSVDSTAAGIEATISNRKFSALAPTALSHTVNVNACENEFCCLA